MKKFFSWMLVAVTALLASCSQEDELYADLGGEELMTIQVGIPASQLATRAGSDAFKDPELSGMRVTLFICKEGKIVSILNESSHDFGSGSTAATFTARLIKGQTYNFVAWCDFGDDYYDLPTSEDMSEEPSATMHSTSVVGSNNKYDAYFGRTDAAITSNDIINVVCRRPFALVKVNTTDWNEDAVKNANLRPNGYETTINVPTTVNLYSGETSAAADVTYTASIVEYDQDGNPKELHYDYILASSTKSTLPDFTVKYDQDGTVITDYTFQNIPVQRNYKTNITGNILTKVGTINVTIDPLWNDPDYEVVLTDVENATDVKSALESLQSSNPSAPALGVNVKKETAAATGTERPIEIPASFTTGSGDDVTTTVKQTNINLEGGVKAGDKIIIRDEYNHSDDPDEDNKVAITTYPGVIYISAADASASDFDFQTPKATVYLNGTKIKDAIAQTAENTFVIDANSEITGTLTVKKGNVDVYGKVNSIVRSSDNPDATTTVNLYDGAVWTNWATEKATEKITPIVNVGTYTFDPTGYNIEGSIVTANSNDTWTVSLDDNWTSYAASSFSNVSGTTITIMSAAELALFAKNVNADVNYTDYTFKLGTYIDLAAHQWVPIMLDEKCATNLTFDGCGYSISGLKMNRQESYSGLFGTYFSHGTVIKNVVINNPQITQTQDPEKAAQEVGLNYTAALVAHMGCGNVQNCSVIGGTISGQDQVGGIVGYNACGTIDGCKVEGTTISAAVCRVGGIVGKVNPDSEYAITNNVVSNLTITAADKVDGMLSAGALIGQVMTGSTWTISDNTIKNVTTSTDTDNTFVPVGEFRKGYYKADAVTGNHIKNISWYPTTTVYYDMKNPANTSESVRVWNAAAPTVAKIGSTEYKTFDAAIEAVPTTGDATITMATNIGSENNYSAFARTFAYTLKSGQNLTLDLAGHQVYAKTTVNGETAFFRVENGATLTIKDSGTNGAIYYLDANDNTGGFVICSAGKLTLESGLLENKTNCVNSAIQGAVDVHANEWGTNYTADTEFTMTGGTLKSDNDNTLRLYDSSKTGSGNVNIKANISGGEIYGKDAVFIMANWTKEHCVKDNIYMNNITANVSGGKFDTMNGIRVTGNVGETNNKDYKAIQINVTGGTFTTKDTEKYRVNNVAFQETTGWTSTEASTANLRSYTNVVWTAQ